MYLLSVMAAIQVKRSQEIQNQGCPLCFYPAAIWGKSQVPAITCISCPALVDVPICMLWQQSSSVLQSLSCFCRAYNKHPELSSSWLFYLPSFLPRAAAAQPSLRRCHCSVVGLGPPKVGVVGAVPDSLPQTQGQTFLGEAKSQRPEGWRVMVEPEADGTKGPMSPGMGSTSVVAEAVATHRSQGNLMQIPAALGSSRHQLPPPSPSGLRSLDSSTLSQYTPGPTGTGVRMILALSNGWMGLSILRIQQEREQCIPRKSGAHRQSSGFHRSCPTLWWRA